MIQFILAGNYLQCNQTERVDRDYQLAVMKGNWNKVSSWAKAENNTLLSLDEYLSCHRITESSDGGVQTVGIDAIKGSLNRSQDFDKAFMPLQKHTRERWMNVDYAYHHNKALLPVTLRKVGEIYFVVDGHHRISVASLHGQTFIDAYITNIEVDE